MSDTKRYTLYVCSTCEGELKGRRCENGHHSYPAKQLEVVAAHELDSLITFTARTIALLPDDLKRTVVQMMTEKVGQRV